MQIQTLKFGVLKEGEVMGVMGGREGVMVMAVVAGVMARAPCTIEKHREMQVSINNSFA